MTQQQKEVLRSILATEPDQPIIINILERSILQAMLDDAEDYERRLARITDGLCCTRGDAHEGPCNGYPRPECPQQGQYRNDAVGL
jgi:hypothetical protein